MMVSTKLTLFALASHLTSSSAAYTLLNNFNSSNWLSSFQVQALNPDPTNGYVTYLSASDAAVAGIYKITPSNQVYIGVDNTSVLDPNGAGRKSVRLASNTAFTKGLYIADFAHIPGTACGSWPAFWMLGSGTWPGNGEIDIIEGINNQTRNQVTVHSRSGCNVTVDPQYGETGNWGSSTPACNAGAGGGYNGCTVFSGSSASYGSGFNAAGGGYYTLHWTSTAIKVWFFSKANSVPADVQSGTPNPSGWGTPLASFTGCAFDNYFAQMQLMFNIDFCGSWAGAQFPNSPVCSQKAKSCNAFVAANPHAFDESYFLVNSVRVYSG